VLEWAHPAFLSLLALVPLLRWVHRRRVVATETPVAALFLWPEAAPAVGERRARTSDPRWRRRAAMLALLVIGAAGPSLVRPGSQAIDVHFDDAPSMRARETDGTRVTLAIRELGALLRQADAEEIRIVSVREPARTLTLDPRVPDGWSSAIAQWVDLRPRTGPLPMPGVLAASREHWLVTDGADPAVEEWLRGAPIARVIHVGAATENVAVTLLSTRPHLQDRRQLRAVVEITNAGTRETSRRLEIRSADHVIVSRELRLRSGEVSEQAFDVPNVSGARLHAQIAPHDAVAEDDEQTLELSGPLAASVRLDAECGPHLRSALRAHPTLSMVDGVPADVAVSCSEALPGGGPPTLWFRPSHGPADDARPFPLDANDAAIVAHGQGGMRVLEVPVDMERPDWIRQPEYPAFVAELLDRIVGRPLLDPIVSQRVPPGAVRITPRDLRGITTMGVWRVAARRLDLVRVALACAVLVLTLDIIRTRHAQ
jgi:hypothetical protein